MTRTFLSSLIALACTLISITNLQAQEPTATWQSQVLPVELTVGYAVQVLDLSGDQRLDIAIVDSKRILWLENPDWKVHVVYDTPEAKFDNVCFAFEDIDRDGHLDMAIGHDWQFGNSDSGGKIGWLKAPADPRQAWAYHAITEEPTTHRMRWIDWNNDGRRELVVAPLKGRGSRPPAFQEAGVRLMALTPPADPSRDPWPMQVITDQLHVMHNIDVVDYDHAAGPDLLTASFEGVHAITYDSTGAKLTHLGSGHRGEAPALGASEIRMGRLGSGKAYLATIEPWHGDRVVVYTEPATPGNLWTRHVLDEQLKWGHAVACANVDADADQELVIGVRDELSNQHRCGVRIYDPVDPAQGKWNRSLVEPGQVAVEDLVTGDLDGDGRVEIIAVGRATHNAVIYRLK